MLVSVLVEAAQSITGVGTCQTSDVVRNVVGGVLAATVALVLVALDRRLRAATRSDLSSGVA